MFSCPDSGLDTFGKILTVASSVLINIYIVRLQYGLVAVRSNRDSSLVGIGLGAGTTLVSCDMKSRVTINFCTPRAKL